MRKIIFLVLAMMFLLTGCGGDKTAPSTSDKTSTGKISYQEYQKIKQQFKQINDMFIYDPINDEIVSAMANPDEFKGDRGTKLNSNLQAHQTELVAAKRFFVKKEELEKVNQYNQLVTQAIDKKTQALAQAEDYMNTKNPQSKTLYVEYNNQAVGYVDQASQIVSELESDVE